jgi:hypothetical protein
MTQQHPITPPPTELVQQWASEWMRSEDSRNLIDGRDNFMATRAAQWGADQELEACCEWGDKNLPVSAVHYLRAARRPKPPSLKKQALALINHDPANQPFLSDKGIDTIRRALEQLPDHE